jgi:hypothetical protein
VSTNLSEEVAGSAPRLGERYIFMLSKIHKMLKPKTYLEIGSCTGASLAMSSCDSIAIDPAFKLESNFMGDKPSCRLYQMTSDNFFSEYNPSEIFGRPVDFAFLDGMHLSEFLLRDFYNIERYCTRNSIIALHDCLPPDFPMARRQMVGPGVVRSHIMPNAWAGDVWKVVVALKQYRTDLRIYALDAKPTGLIMITSLDPGSKVLRENYFDINDQFRSMGEQEFNNFLSETEIISTTEFDTMEKLASYFYLY